MMLNLDVSTVGNNTILKFGGWDELAIIHVSNPGFYAKEFPTIPGSW
jgi:hypothetical protein